MLGQIYPILFSLAPLFAPLPAVVVPQATPIGRVVTTANLHVGVLPYYDGDQLGLTIRISLAVL